MVLAYAPGSWSRLRNIVTHSGGLAIKIMFPNHVAAHPRYTENLRTFVKSNKKAAEEAKNEVPAVNGLGLNGDSRTATSSQTQTLRKQPGYYDDK